MLLTGRLLTSWILLYPRIVYMLLKCRHISLYVPIEVLFLHTVLPLWHLFDDATYVPDSLTLNMLLLLLLLLGLGDLPTVRCKLLLSFHSVLTSGARNGSFSEVHVCIIDTIDVFLSGIHRVVAAYFNSSSLVLVWCEIKWSHCSMRWAVHWIFKITVTMIVQAIFLSQYLVRLVLKLPLHTIILTGLRIICLILPQKVCAFDIALQNWCLILWDISLALHIDAILLFDPVNSIMLLIL